ncbi:MAG: hypothetical protein ABSD21_02760 [Rhizomicrobium sp.]
MRLFTIAVAIAAAAFVAGCDQHPSKTVKIKGKDGSVTITSNGEHVTMKSDNGKTTVEINTNGLGNQRLPDFAPVYPGAQVKGSVTAQTEGGGTFAFESSAAPEKVIAFYKDKAKSAGLAEKLSMSGNGGMTYVASADDGKKTLQVIAAKSGTGSQVEVYWAAR